MDHMLCLHLMQTGCVGAWWWAHARHGHLDTEPVRCLHCQGKGHMLCAHLFALRNCDAYSSAFEDSMKKIRVTVVHAAD